MKTWILIRRFIVVLSIIGACQAARQIAVMAQPGTATHPVPTMAIRDDADPSGLKPLSCLPKDVQADEVVTYHPDKRKKVTVAKKLLELKSRCRRGKLVDAKGREIRFFRPSCWGNPPADYMEIQQQETATLANLKKRYTVIVFGCSVMTQ